MTLSPQLVDQLATRLAPAIGFLLAEVAGIPPLPANNDIDGARAWLAALDDATLLTVLAALPKQELVTEALRMLVAPPAIAMPAPGKPPHITSRLVNIVDRHEVWAEVLSLQASARRILHVKGDARSGKSHLRWLVQEYCDQHGHGFLYVDLEDLQTIERVVTLGINTQLATPIQVEARHVAATADLAWARAVARAVFTRIGKELAGKMPWLVFDHFDRMPMASDGESGAFFNALIDLVAKQPATGPTAANAMRLVLIDMREVAGDARSRTITRGVDRVSESDIAMFIRSCKPALSDAEVAARTKEIVDALRADFFMADLGEKLSTLVEAP